MPAAPTTMPTLSQIRAWSTTHLTDASTDWNNTADNWEDAFTSVAREIGVPWKGEAAEAAMRQAAMDRVKVVTVCCDPLRRAARIASDGAGQIQDAKHAALHAVARAEEHGFIVGEDLSVTDPNFSLTAADGAAREALGQAHANAIGNKALGLTALDQKVATGVTGAAGNIGQINFADAPLNYPSAEEVIQAVDYKTSTCDGDLSAIPDDPKKFYDWWESLSERQKNALYLSDHSIGNRDGMPAADRDHYNQLALENQIARAQLSAAQAEALKNKHPAWALGENIPAPIKPGAIFDDRLEYEAWQRQYDAAQAGAKYLPDLQALDQTLADDPNRLLLLLDTESGSQAHAAIAIGNPDTADHVSVTTPGLNTTVYQSIGDMATEATNLRQEAFNQLQFTPGRENETVSTIAWLGYDVPQPPGRDDLSGSLAGLADVTHVDLAKAGASDLASFYDGLQVTHEGAPAHLTAIGHSYGSLTTGLALRELGNHEVSDALFYGSPGIEADTPQQLGLQPGHVYAMQTPDDPIARVYDVPPVLRGALGMGDFGPNPATTPNFTRLETGAVTVPEGFPGGGAPLQGASGHADYPRLPNDGGMRTTVYNTAAVVAGTKPIPGD